MTRWSRAPTAAPSVIRDNALESGPLRVPFPQGSLSFGGKWQEILRYLAWALALAGPWAGKGAPALRERLISV